MSAQSTFALGAGVMFLSGVGIPVGAALNAGLGRSLESPVGATAILYVVSFLLAMAALAISGLPDFSKLEGVGVPAYLGGFFFVAYVLAITFLAPRIGLGNAVFFVLLGQVASSALIDHFGLLGAVREPLGARRGLGLVVMAAGLWLAKKPL